MTSIAACNQNDESDETNTSHGELEDNDDDSQIMLGAGNQRSIVYIDVCIAQDYRLYKVSLHLLELRNTLTSKHYAKGIALHANLQLLTCKT